MGALPPLIRHGWCTEPYSLALPDAKEAPRESIVLLCCCVYIEVQFFVVVVIYSELSEP